jgi:N-methylhydantoinase B
MPVDPISLEVFKNMFISVADEMGVALLRTAYSSNIKERRDFSCAMFDAEGRMVAQAAHIPVHLGAMPAAVAVARAKHSFGPGDLVIFNDPYLGGTHLPDVTMVTPVFALEGGGLLGFLASRAHQSDFGGMSPGSMPVSTELYQEGLIIPPIKLVEGGKVNEAAQALIYRNVRTPAERAGDFSAQMAAHRTGEQRLQDLARRYGPGPLAEAQAAVMDYAEAATRAALRALPEGDYDFADVLDDDGFSREPVPIRVRVSVRNGELTADFTGSAPEQLGSVNAVLAVTQSATYYVVRCLIGEDLPMNDGCFRPVRVVAPEGTVVNARPPRAVAAGNVETSQRITDVVLGALAQAAPERIPAASSGSMSNVTVGGYDADRARPFAYYETVAGGAGGGPQRPGLSAVHTHMTNTLNTPVEALEYTYPFRIAEYSLRDGSGGAGQHPGGDGLRRVYEFLAPANLTVISDRRVSRPYGLAGGGPGAAGRNTLRRASGTEEPLPGKVTLPVQPGDRLELETPGGGGWGASS